MQKCILVTMEQKGSHSELDMLNNEETQDSSDSTIFYKSLNPDLFSVLSMFKTQTFTIKEDEMFGIFLTKQEIFCK